MRFGFIILVCICLGALASGWGATAVEYRQQAEAALARGDYATASECFRKEAAIFRAKGDVEAAKVIEWRAERWSTVIELYRDVPADPNALARNSTLAKFEPLYGCYHGAYCENDDELPGNGPVAREIGFGERTKKPLATAFRYLYYGKRFPSTWAKALLAQGCAPHIAYEPNDGLEAVKDDAYLQQFARDAAACGGPIFLRFACEMNGEWVIYSGDPALYRQKFRLVHDVMARLAPNVAMIWCPNHIPESTVDDYYPGDDYVDWVGVNFYSVMYHNNNRKTPGFYECPTIFLQYVYDRYAARKPISICEYSASHYDVLEHQDRTDLAIVRFSQLYTALPRRYPRVKMIDVFDNNNLKYALPGRKINDYCVTNSPQLLKAYQDLVAPDYFLSKYLENPTQLVPTIAQQPVRSGAELSGLVRLSAWIKSYDNLPCLIYKLDGTRIAGIDTPGEYRCDLDTRKYENGSHLLTLTILDTKGRVAMTRGYNVKFRN